MFNLDLLRDYKDAAEMLIPVLVIVIPAFATLYFKLSHKLHAVKESFSKKVEMEMQDWETNFSRNLVQAVGFYLDGIDANPYCHSDRIIYLGLENGVVGPGRIHSMYMSVQAETSGLSRLPKLASNFQRVPYATLNSWCAELTSTGILKIPNLEESKYRDIGIYAGAGSSVAIPIYTKEHWFAGVVVFNYLETNFNNQGFMDKEKELLNSIKTYIEGQMLQMDLARLSWMKEHHIN